MLYPSLGRNKSRSCFHALECAIVMAMISHHDLVPKTVLWNIQCMGYSEGCAEKVQSIHWKIMKLPPKVMWDEFKSAADQAEDLLWADQPTVAWPHLVTIFSRLSCPSSPQFHPESSRKGHGLRKCLAAQIGPLDLSWSAKIYGSSPLRSIYVSLSSTTREHKPSFPTSLPVLLHSRDLCKSLGDFSERKSFPAVNLCGVCIQVLNRVS